MSTQELGALIDIARKRCINARQVASWPKGYRPTPEAITPDEHERLIDALETFVRPMKPPEYSDFEAFYQKFTNSLRHDLGAAHTLLPWEVVRKAFVAGFEEASMGIAKRLLEG